ncbi:MAG TPA: hypothetical protein VG099_31930 [Gemmataceae bacterium]|jgi:hypothetical protein|nr:hypothetical protein [Gemmataceae bacterium]
MGQSETSNGPVTQQGSGTLGDCAAIPLVAVLVALLDGRAEIRHTEWACPDIAE